MLEQVVKGAPYLACDRWRVGWARKGSEKATIEKQGSLRIGQRIGIPNTTRAPTRELESPSVSIAFR